MGWSPAGAKFSRKLRCNPCPHEARLPVPGDRYPGSGGALRRHHGWAERHRRCNASWTIPYAERGEASRAHRLRATVYGPQSFFFTALQSLPASLVELVFYVYPALVLAGAWVFYKRPVSWRSGIAVVGAAMGTGLVLGLARLGFGAPLILAVATPVCIRPICSGLNGCYMMSERSRAPRLSRQVRLASGCWWQRCAGTWCHPRRPWAGRCPSRLSA